MLSHPSRQNPSGKLNPNSFVNDYDSDGDNGVSLYGTTRGGRGRGQATGARARGGRGSRSRGATPTRGRVSKNLNLVAAITSYGCRKTVLAWNKVFILKCLQGRSVQLSWTGALYCKMFHFPVRHICRKLLFPATCTKETQQLLNSHVTW